MKQVFISSTVNDLKEYRKAVGDGFNQYVKSVPVMLNESPRGGGYDDTVLKCKEGVEQCDGFLGIFAYYYGSIPPNQAKRLSITHMEFNWALERWGALPAPPMFIFMPDEGCDSCAPDDWDTWCDTCHASKDLQKEAADILKTRDAAYVSEHTTLLKQFHTEVKNPAGQWRIVKFFRNKTDLAHQSTTSWLNWHNVQLESALAARAEEAVSQGAKISDEDLGMLGRTAHIKAAKKVVNQVLRTKNTRGVCLVVHGTAQAGHEAFCAHLVAQKPFKPRNGKLKLSRPQSGQYELESLLHWVRKKLPLPADAPFPADVDELADQLQDALTNQPVTLFLDGIRRFYGGLPAFYQQFWQPLHARLEALNPAHPLVMVVTSYTPKQDAWDPFTCDASAPAGDDSLVCVPELGDFTNDEMEEWLDEIEMPIGEWDGLIQEAFADAAGNPDHTPVPVLNRLRKEFNRKWPQEGGWIDED